MLHQSIKVSLIPSVESLIESPFGKFDFDFITCPRLVVELEHLKIETRLIDEMFASEMGEYVFLM
jgi:hypothetical protein